MLTEVQPPLVLALFRLSGTLDSQTLVMEIYSVEPRGYFSNLQIINSHGKTEKLIFFWVVATEEQSLFFTDFSFKVKEQKK